jgi:hypothetical protein
MTVEQHAENFKQRHGDGEFTVHPDGKIDVPTWLAAMLIHLSGIRSKKSRIQKKVVKLEVIRLLRRAAAESKQQ